MHDPLILAIHPRPRSTEAALFRGERELWREGRQHAPQDLHRFPSVMGQLDYRFRSLQDLLLEQDTDPARLDGVVGTGGLLQPVPGGTYRVTPAMLAELDHCRCGCHVSNLGAPLARKVADLAGGRPAFVVDPLVVDELLPEARLSGMPEIPRKSLFHALSQRAAGRRAAEALGRPYEECHLVVAHLGFGISVGAHLKGRVAEVNNALEGEGPFSGERSGGLPCGELVRLCFSGRYDFEEMMDRVTRKGGLLAHLGTDDPHVLDRRIREGDERARLVVEALAYQVAKEIASRGAVLRGVVDGVVLTGHLAWWDTLVEGIRRWAGWVAPFQVFPGEDDLAALAEGALRVLLGQEEARRYEEEIGGSAS